MHNPNKIIARIPDTHAIATATNGAATVTLTAPGLGWQWLVLSTTISMSGDPAAAVAFTIVSGARNMERIEFPAAACAPYNSHAAYVGLENTSVVANLPALGSGIVGTVTVRAMKIPVGSA